MGDPLLFVVLVDCLSIGLGHHGGHSNPCLQQVASIFSDYAIYPIRLRWSLFIGIHMIHVDASIALTLPDGLEDCSVQDDPLSSKQLPPVKYGRLLGLRGIQVDLLCVAAV